ncbi:MAG: DUF86 domain-containing protein [Runella sp.]
MDIKVKKYLFDILVCINNIESYLGTPKLYENYAANDMLQDAVERNLEIIGEATNQLLKLNPNIALSNARRIVDTRNRIIHGYDTIEPVNIWAIIINYLPTLKEEVTQLLNE